MNEKTIERLRQKLATAKQHLDLQASNNNERGTQIWAVAVAQLGTELLLAITEPGAPAEAAPEPAPLPEAPRSAMPPEIPSDLMGIIVDEVFDGAIEDPSIIEDIYRVIARQCSAHVEPAASATPELKPADIERGWRDTFSTGNPFCPCDLKSFTKAVNWAVAALSRKVGAR